MYPRWVCATPLPLRHTFLLGDDCAYIDPNPLTRLNNKGHNYFLSQNPYVLNSYAGFGEAYYNVTQDLKLIGGLRWTDDEKHFTDIPSELLVPGYGYAVDWRGQSEVEPMDWPGRGQLDAKARFHRSNACLWFLCPWLQGRGRQPAGRRVADLRTSDDVGNPIHPLTFKPEFVDAFELGTKNTLLDGALTLNGDIFYYNYKGYQISRIVDRTAINDNFDAHIKGAELEATWEPVPGLKFNFAGGYEDARANKGDHSVDLMDRTAGNPNWMVLKPFPTQASNCILPSLRCRGNFEPISRQCGLRLTVLWCSPIMTMWIRSRCISYVQHPTYVEA